MKTLLHLSLELLATLFVLNVLVLFIPKGIRMIFSKTLHLIEMLFSVTFDILNKVVITTIGAVKNFKVPTKNTNVKQQHKQKKKTKQVSPSPSSVISDEDTCKVINLNERIK